MYFRGSSSHYTTRGGMNNGSSSSRGSSFPIHKKKIMAMTGSRDARDKLISSRRPVTDARNVIRQHVVEKVGDLRSVLPRVRGGISKRGRPGTDLRSSLVRLKGLKSANHSRPQSRPELVYAHEMPGARYKGPKNTNVTVGRGGKVTISRQRGRSIDREDVQPTGIPSHMRRQPSPPPPRAHTSPSPHQRRQQRRSPSPISSRPGLSYTPSPPPASRPQSYITTPRGHTAAPNKSYDGWVVQEPHSSRMFDYRHRSRSPIYRETRMPPQQQFSGHMRGYSADSRERWERERMGDHGMMRKGFPEPHRLPHSPEFREDRRLAYTPVRQEPREHRQQLSYVNKRSPSPQYQSSLRMDRQTPRKTEPKTYVQQQSPEQMYYVVKVTSLSHEVSEDDVVELFSDIGPLVSAHLVTKGHAEVCFVHKKDAKTAIEKYDRRELDGIPMNLKLMEKPSTGRIR